MSVNVPELSRQPKPTPDVGYFSVTPALGANPELTRNLWGIYTKHSKALVLEVFATGTVPSILDPLIKECVDGGGSAFLLSNNPGDEKGITKLAYEANMGAVGAGAIPLRDVNVNNRIEVLKTIQEAISQGKIGNELNKVVIEKFCAPAPQNSA
ncbi:MAG: hypothetical protein HY429_04855 [Candidatus Levybacteria bacterium]|nr:hypothetical protein [Candidatus Levybacteria bacterium]